MKKDTGYFLITGDNFSNPLNSGQSERPLQTDINPRRD